MSLTLCPTGLQSTKRQGFFFLLKTKIVFLKEKKKKNCVFRNSNEKNNMYIIYVYNNMYVCACVSDFQRLKPQ